MTVPESLVIRLVVRLPLLRHRPSARVDKLTLDRCSRMYLSTPAGLRTKAPAPVATSLAAATPVVYRTRSPLGNRTGINAGYTSSTKISDWRLSAELEGASRFMAH